MSEDDMKMEDDASRKRPLDSDIDNGGSKRSNVDAENDLQFKIMLPNVAVGAIIGKGGEMIAKLQEENGIRMLVSKNNDVYPGTNERVCRITGSIPGILQVLRFIITTGYAKMEDNSNRDIYDLSNYDRCKEIKLLVPNISAGVVIGKGGSYIKEVHENTGAYIEVSKRDKEPRLPERVVTFAGNPEELLNCAEMLMQKLAVDKNASTLTNVTYLDMQNLSIQGSRSMGPEGGFDMAPSSQQFGAHAFDLKGGAPMGMRRDTGRSSDVMRDPYSGGSYHQDYDIGPGGGGSMRSAGAPMNSASALLSGASNANVLGFLTNLQATLRSAGYNDTAISEITQAMQILAKYNILGLGLGFGLAAISNPGIGSTLSMGAAGLMMRNAGGNFNFSGAAMEPIGRSRGQPVEDNITEWVKAQLAGLGSEGKSGGFRRGDEGRLSGPQMIGRGASSGDYESRDAGRIDRDLMDTSDDRYYYRSREHDRYDIKPVVRGAGGNGHSEDHGGHLDDDEPEQKIEVEVPENLVGVILGKQGSTLMELQRFSRAHLEVSRKGVFAPGTDNRLVYISGSTEAVRLAKRLVEARVLDERQKRQEVNKFGPR